MKKYTVHIHFTLSNMFLCSNHDSINFDLNLKYKIIDYYVPGIILANEIKKQYNIDTSVYFLKNHGLIITSDNINELIDIYIKVFNYFNNLLDNQYNQELEAFNISNYIYKKLNKSLICRNYNFDDINKIINIKYCFPDLIVYFQKIKIIANLDDLDEICDILIYNNHIYIIADSLTKLYCMIETLDKYINKNLKSKQIIQKIILFIYQMLYLLNDINIISEFKHNDLKCNNIVLSAEQHPLLIDFGSSQFIINLGTKIEFITFHQNYSYEDFIQEGKWLSVST
jgi:hypothetical protein